MIPVWLVGSLAANVCITALEYLNRTSGFATFFDAAKVTWPLILGAQIGLFYAWRGAPSMMTAWATFFSVGYVLRLASNHFLVGEPLAPLGWAGVALIVAGALLVKTAH